MLKPKPTQGDTSWFVQDRFGIFLHWGLYSLPARHEWAQSREELPPEAYRQYFERFNPMAYDPQRWARVARGAGMKYAVITTKHHEGFCLWDTQYTDYKVTNTPTAKMPFDSLWRPSARRAYGSASIIRSWIGITLTF